MTALKLEIDDTTEDTIIRFEAQIHAAQEHYKGVSRTAQEHIDALRFKKDEICTTKRKRYLSERYQVVKIQGYMAAQR